MDRLPAASAPNVLCEPPAIGTSYLAPLPALLAAGEREREREIERERERERESFIVPACTAVTHARNLAWDQPLSLPFRAVQLHT